MLTTAASIQRDTTLPADICIVGGGPTGITVALQLLGSPLRVVLLESGDLDVTPEAQSLHEGRSIGITYAELDEVRFRGLGGSSARWAGWCRPLDAVDMGERPWVEASGWPIDRTEMDPFYEEAARLCELGDSEPAIPALYSPPFVGGDVALATWRGSPPTRFGERYRPALEGSARIQAITDATAVRVLTDGEERRAVGVEVRSRAGNAFTVAAGTVVLCAGTIETARLLLASGRPGIGLGNQHDLVGRNFMDHPQLVTGHIVLADRAERRQTIPAIDRGVRGMAARVTLQRPKGAVRHAYTVTEERQRSERLLNGAVYLHTVSPAATEESEAYRAMRILAGSMRSPRRFLRQVMERSLPHGGLGALLATMGRGLPEVARALYHEGLRRPRRLALFTQAEQLPNPQSRVTIDHHRRDPLGVPRVTVDWRLTEVDKASAARTQEIIAEQLRDAGLGRLEPIPAFTEPGGDWGPGIGGGYHHLGTARMADDPRLGVVDRHGAVHTVDGLYVGDPSVFPTGGFANPMLTSVALAVRLGRHLAGQVGGR